jgi:hypothetical protein
MRFRSLGADDIIISDTRLDASTYAAGLADELTRRGFSCFIDTLGAEPTATYPRSVASWPRVVPRFQKSTTEPPSSWKPPSP